MTTPKTIHDFLPGKPYTVAEVAGFLRCTSQTVRHMIADGRLKSVVVAKPKVRHRIDGAEVRKYYGIHAGGGAR